MIVAAQNVIVKTPLPKSVDNIVPKYVTGLLLPL